MSKNKTFSIKFLKLISYFCITWGSFFSFFGFLAVFTESGEKLLQLIFGLIMIGGGPLLGGIALLLKVKKMKAAEPDIPAEIERKVLICAKNSNGVITSTQLSLNSGLSIDESRNALEYMTKKGLSIPEVDEEGVVKYKFIEM